MGLEKFEAMNRFKDAAIKTLKEAKRPLSSIEITRLAIESGILRSNGKTPERTMNAQLNLEIKSKGVASSFVKVGRSTFGLSENFSNKSKY